MESFREGCEKEVYLGADNLTSDIIFFILTSSQLRIITSYFWELEGSWARKLRFELLLLIANCLLQQHKKVSVDSCPRTS